MASRPGQSLTILGAMRDPALFGRWFTPADSWHAWSVFLKALFGLSFTEAEAAVFHRHTGRGTPPCEPAKEAWLVVGRRGGKSRIAALVAVFVACFRDYTKILAPGERGTLMAIAADRRQARVVFSYITGLLDGVPMLARLVESRTKETVTLVNRVTIEVHTASFREVRGYTVIGAICDEISFWRSEESANPDTEILNGLRPGMATVPGALLLCISSPYARRGALWEAYKAHYGQDRDPVLVWRGDTRSMNPTVEERVITSAYEQDEAAASAEFGAEFRLDIETFVAREAVEVCVVPDRRELPPLAEVRYFGFCDPSGGSQDSMTVGIAHHENGTTVLDAVREVRPPFSPEEVVSEFAEVLKTYRCSCVVGDRFGGEFCREPFRKLGIEYRLSEKPKSDLYRDVLPMINSRTVALLDHPRLIAQLCGLERRTARGGRDSIDHGPNQHDDLANVAAGALTLAARDAGREPLRFLFMDEGDEAEKSRQEYAAEEMRAIIRERGSYFPGD